MREVVFMHESIDATAVAGRVEVGLDAACGPAGHVHTAMILRGADSFVDPKIPMKTILFLLLVAVSLPSCVVQEPPATVRVASTPAVVHRRYISYSDTDPYYRVYYRDGDRSYYRRHYYDDDPVRHARVDKRRYYYRAPASHASIAFGY